MDKKAIFENLKIDVRILVVTNAGTFDGKSLCPNAEYTKSNFLSTLMADKLYYG